MFGKGLNGLHRGTRKNGCLFEVGSVWGAEMHAPNLISWVSIARQLLGFWVILP